MQTGVLQSQPLSLAQVVRTTACGTAQVLYGAYLFVDKSQLGSKLWACDMFYGRHAAVPHVRE